jgi:hypothetical protein
MTGESSSSRKIKYPQWEPEFRAALLEPDREKLLERIELAEAAIFSRIQGLSASANDREERRAIEDALSGLRTLKKE